MSHIKVIGLCLIGLFISLKQGSAQDTLQPHRAKDQIIHINGVFPNLSILVTSDQERSESGIGALIPWADKLWMIGYVAHIRGSRIGLYEIHEDMTMIQHPESVTGTFANRMIHNPSEQAIIGPHFIDKHGQVRTSLNSSIWTE